MRAPEIRIGTMLCHASWNSASSVCQTAGEWSEEVIAADGKSMPMRPEWVDQLATELSMIDLWL